MAQVYVKTHTGATNQSGTTATVSVVGATAGNHFRVVATVQSENRTISGIAGGGNTYASVDNDSDGASSRALILWHSMNVAGGSYTVTITFDAAVTAAEVFIDEFSGVATTNALDVHNTNGVGVGASPIVLSGVGPTTNANDCVYAVGVSVNAANARPLTFPPTSGYSTAYSAGQVNGQANQFGSAYKAVTATGTQAVTWAWTGGNSGSIVVMAAFKDAAGGGGDTLTATLIPSLVPDVPNTTAIVLNLTALAISPIPDAALIKALALALLVGNPLGPDVPNQSAGFGNAAKGSTLDTLTTLDDVIDVMHHNLLG